ncbi:MAG: guanylate kinase [Candidatus Omnitrophota bacterium]|nr:MAG: guanylate kinase [Candidatus Omnitrophota bacterium]
MGKKRGKLFVVSAPSGSGKTTLCRELIRSLRGKRKLVRSISVTTRRRRGKEREGRDYFFVSPREFIKRRNRQEFLEWARVLNNYYGTPCDFIEKHTGRGDDVLLNIDVQGAMKIKRKKRDAVLIFILPPSFKVLEGRLRRRSTESKAEIARRLKFARHEMRFVRKYNYAVLNDEIARALKQLKEIIRQERKKK